MKRISSKDTKNKVTSVSKTPFLRKILSKMLYFLLVPVVTASILFSVFFKITEEKHAKETLTMIIATSFSSKGIEDETEIIEIKKQMDELNVDSIVPIEGLSIEIKRQDIEELSPKDLRLKFFSKISDILYYQDKESIEKVVTDENMRSNIESAGFINLISKNGHKKVETLFFYLFLCSVLLGTGVYLVNRGVARFSTTAKAVIFASLPGLIITSGIKIFLSSGTSVSLSEETSFDQIFASIIKNAVPSTIDIFFKTYLWVFIFSSSVFIASQLYKFWKKMFRKQTSDLN